MTYKHFLENVLLWLMTSANHGRERIQLWQASMPSLPLHRCADKIRCLLAIFLIRLRISHGIELFGTYRVTLKFNVPYPEIVFIEIYDHIEEWLHM